MIMPTRMLFAPILFDFRRQFDGDRIKVHNFKFSSAILAREQFVLHGVGWNEQFGSTNWTNRCRHLHNLLSRFNLVSRCYSSTFLLMLNNWLLNLYSLPCLRGRARVGVRFLPKQKPPSSACLDGGSLTLFVAQRSYPDLRLGFLLCFCLLSNVYIIFPLDCPYATKNPPVRAGSFALFMLSKPKIPDLDRAALLGLLGERIDNHHSSFTDNGDEFNAAQVRLQCATCTEFIGKWHKSYMSEASLKRCAILVTL
jgi:hypothetical protein